ncbi:MAG: membrane protein insertion efficiency factor YidD [Alphaproteobacteria bacterium]|nr:membrane protein insertion efficiency factor YidD [Alphaproteobacteria bacterium]
MKNLLTRLLKVPVHVYRYAISPLLGPRCRFYPSCSEYCLQALEKHGPFHGLILTARRLLACHPWSGRQGYDPVPEKQQNCD